MFLYYDWPFWHMPTLYYSLNLGLVFSESVVFYANKLCQVL